MGNMTLTRKRGVLDSSRVLFLPVRDIRPNPNQPRTTFSLKSLEELSASIREHGILQPLTVRRAEDKGYELISGERRLRAANKGEITGKMKMPGDPRMVAGVNIQLKGFGDFDGKYSIDKSTHKIPPYTTDIEFSKVVEGY